MQRAVVVVEATLIAVHDQHREVRRVLVVRRALLALLPARQAARALGGTQRRLV